MIFVFCVFAPLRLCAFFRLDLRTILAFCAFGRFFVFCGLRLCAFLRLIFGRSAFFARSAALNFWRFALAFSGLLFALPFLSSTSRSGSFAFAGLHLCVSKGSNFFGGPGFSGCRRSRSPVTSAVSALGAAPVFRRFPYVNLSGRSKGAVFGDPASGGSRVAGVGWSLFCWRFSVFVCCSVFR